MLQEMVKLNVLFAFQNMLSTILPPSVIHKINDQLVILLFAPKYFTNSSVFNGIQWRKKIGMTESHIYLWWLIQVADCCLISTSADFDAVHLIMTWDTHSFVVFN